MEKLPERIEMEKRVEEFRANYAHSSPYFNGSLDMLIDMARLVGKLEARTEMWTKMDEVQP